MPVYATTSGFADYRRHPSALLLIIGGHAALIAAVMAAKMVIPPRVPDPPIIVDTIKAPEDPPPVDPPTPQEHQQAPQSTPFSPPTTVPIPIFDPPDIRTGTLPIPDPGPFIAPDPGPKTIPVPPEPVRIAATLITPDRLLRPPYPADKQRLDEEGSLRLKLFIDARGRVTAVEPVGKVDRSFFESARRHLIANWRYKPATEDGHPVASSMTITLTFRLA